MYGHTQITMFQTGYANSCHCKALLIEIETCWCRKMCVIVWLIFVETMPKGEPKSQTFQGQTQRALSPAYIQIQALHTMDNWYMWIRMLTTLPRDDFYHVLWQSCHRPSYRPYVCNKHFNNSLFCSHLRNALQKRNNFAIKEDNPKRVIIKKYKKNQENIS